MAGRVAETIAAELRGRILAGGADAERLPTQDQLVEDFGVSHPSVREALRILETEGLVTVRRGNVGGAEVHHPDESSAAYHLGLALQGRRTTLQDLAAGLQLMEPVCAAECARRADRHAELVPALRANLERSTELVGAGAEFTLVARAFHDLLVAYTPNTTVRVVVGTLVALWSAQEAAWAAAVERSGDYPPATDAAEVLRTHQRLLDEITAGRGPEAERVARAHLVATQAVILDRFDEVIVDAASTRIHRPLTAGHPWRV